MREKISRECAKWMVNLDIGVTPWLSISKSEVGLVPRVREQKGQVKSFKHHHVTPQPNIAQTLSYVLYSSIRFRSSINVRLRLNEALSLKLASYPFEGWRT